MVDEDGVGPHGSVANGPGYNVQIGDSLKELNQKQLGERKTYKPVPVKQECPVQQFLADRKLVGLHGVCSNVEDEGFRVPSSLEMIDKLMDDE